MEASVTGRHLQITDALRDYALDRVQRDLGAFPRIETVHVILNIEKYRQIAEVVVQAPHHLRVESREESDDMYASIDAAIEKAAKQVRRNHDKVIDTHKNRESLGHLEAETRPADETVG